MKLLFFGLFLVGICNAGPVLQEELLVGDFFGDIIAKLIQGVINGICSKIADPINIADKNIVLPDSQLASGHFEVKDLVESGLKGLKATNITVVTISPSKLYVTLGIPSMDINTNYDADILLASLIPIYGNGLANINFKNLQFEMSSGYKLEMFPKMALSINDLSFKLSIDSATFDLHGVINNEAFSVIISQVLDDTIAPFINNHSERLSKLLSPFLEKIINQAFSGSKKLELSATSFEELNEEELKALMILYMHSLQSHPKFDQLF
ncbi:hypothetical protein WA026_008285 [Henosepilachna vigintioctopunctata]|uniref:Uncharacterized protein n=1 Tax=Henosepilachna vigintioctopunctata TaxID=420089 RepID=A0AAW1TQU7_9CUCU